MTLVDANASCINYIALIYAASVENISCVDYKGADIKDMFFPIATHGANCLLPPTT